MIFTDRSFYARALSNAFHSGGGVMARKTVWMALTNPPTNHKPSHISVTTSSIHPTLSTLTTSTTSTRVTTTCTTIFHNAPTPHTNKTYQAFSTSLVGSTTARTPASSSATMPPQPVIASLPPRFAMVVRLHL